MIKLSYILPVYNVERYIGDCLDGIYAQNIPEETFEVICVNDCSPDNSRDIILEYQKEHKNLILVEHNENKGLSAARNTGLLVAKGEYIWFVDSDDMVLPNVAKRLCDYALENQLDVLLFNYQDANENGVAFQICDFFKNTSILDGYSFVNDVFGGTGLVYHMGYVVRFLLRREYVLENELKFPEGEYWEDTVYFPKALLFANRVASLDVVGYSYRHNLTSISGGGKVMSAQKIYDFCFKAGGGLIVFSDEVKDKRLSCALRSYAKSKYINSVLLKLLYATTQEVYHFAKLCSRNRKSLLDELSPYYNLVTKHIVKYPYCMCTLILAMRPIWKVSKIIKK